MASDRILTVVDLAETCNSAKSSKPQINCLKIVPVKHLIDGIKLNCHGQTGIYHHIVSQYLHYCGWQ